MRQGDFRHLLGIAVLMAVFARPAFGQRLTLKITVDGVERKAITSNVPDKAMYLIINTAVGGEWAGAPDRSVVVFGIWSTPRSSL